MIYNSNREIVYEVKIYNSDYRLYSNNIVENALNKVIVFDRLGNHESVKSFVQNTCQQKEYVLQSIDDVIVIN